MKRLFTLCFLSFIGFMQVHSQVVISQIYGGGGNASATYQNDYIELFNPTTNPISLSGFAVQYASAAGTTWAATNLNGSIPARSYYLIQLASNGMVGSALPTPNATGTTNLAAANGKIALTNTTTGLTGSCPTGATIEDFVGYGTANCFFGSGAAPGPSNNTTAIVRKAGGTTNTDDNAADFAVGTPTPRNSAVILPVKLISFTVAATSNSTVFNWKTATETNTSHFEIEQSVNGRDFTLMATVAATGNSNTERNYSYTGALVNATTYYRLKTVDADGKSTTSAVVKVTSSKSGFALGNVYPVPAKNSVTIEWNSNQAGSTSLIVTDVTGRTIRNVTVPANAGFNQYVLDVQLFNSGQYFIRLNNGMAQIQTVITRQ